MATSPEEVAMAAIAEIAAELKVKVDPVKVAQLAGFVIGVLAGDKWGDAEKAGLARAANVTDVDAAEAAAVERNRPR